MRIFFDSCSCSHTLNEDSLFDFDFKGDYDGIGMLFFFKSSYNADKRVNIELMHFGCSDDFAFSGESFYFVEFSWSVLRAEIIVIFIFYNLARAKKYYQRQIFTITLSPLKIIALRRI